MRLNRIALTGYSRSGKDTAAAPLIGLGYTRKCFGDLIKQQVDELVRKHFGFSAFTEIDAEKVLIRPLLEVWGEVNYIAIFNEFFAALPWQCVNTRLVRAPEAKRWGEEGGVLIEILKPGLAPATDWEKKEVELVRPYVFRTIRNDGTVEQLHEKIITLCA